MGATPAAVREASGCEATMERRMIGGLVLALLAMTVTTRWGHALDIDRSAVDFKTPADIKWVRNAAGTVEERQVKQTSTVVETDAGYSVEWPDLESQTKAEKAAGSKTITFVAAAAIKFGDKIKSMRVRSSGPEGLGKSGFYDFPHRASIHIRYSGKKKGK